MGVQAVRHGRDAPENGERSQMERHTGRVKAASWAAALALALGAGMIPLRAAGPGAGGKPAAPAAEPIPEPSVPPGKVTLQWDHLVDSNDRTLEDSGASCRTNRLTTRRGRPDDLQRRRRDVLLAQTAGGFGARARGLASARRRGARAFSTGEQQPRLQLLQRLVRQMMRERQEAIRGQDETAEIAVAERRDVHGVRAPELALDRGPVGARHHADALDMIALQPQEPHGPPERGEERRVVEDHDETTWA